MQILVSSDRFLHAASSSDLRHGMPSRGRALAKVLSLPALATVIKLGIKRTECSSKYQFNIDLNHYLRKKVHLAIARSILYAFEISEESYGNANLANIVQSQN